MSSADGAATPGALRSRSEAPPLGAYVADLWRRREFVLALATGSLRQQHLDTVLGNLWHILNPAMLVGVYYLIFGLVLQTSRGVTNFIGFLAVGIFTFQFAQRTITACGASIHNNTGLIRSLQFPRAVLPMSVVLRELAGYGFSYGVLLLVLLVTGEGVTAGWLAAPVVVLLLTMFAAGLGMMLARVTDRVRDLTNVLPFLFRILFYLSGVIFSIQAFVDARRFGGGTPDDPVSSAAQAQAEATAETVRQLFLLDPFFTYIDLLRDLLMTTYSAEFLVLEVVVAVVIAPLTFAAGLVFFRARERTYGRG